MKFLYSVYGLCIESYFSLPELSSVSESDSRHVDVVIKLGNCPRAPLDLRKDEHFKLGTEEAFLYWPNTGQFCVRGGREITIDPKAGATNDLLRPPLLGVVLAVLLLQRNYLVLHASAVTFHRSNENPRAIAFLGYSGQGKSTMAAALYKKGHQLLADDTIALNFHEEGAPPLIFPALPHLKLRPPSIKGLGEDVTQLARWHPSIDSHVLQTTRAHSLTPSPLKCLYVLEENPIHLELLSSSEALMTLLEHSYSMRLFAEMDIGNDFLRCAKLAQKIPIFRLHRPKNFHVLPDVIRFIEEHQASLEWD